MTRISPCQKYHASQAQGRLKQYQKLLSFLTNCVKIPQKKLRGKHMPQVEPLTWGNYKVQLMPTDIWRKPMLMLFNRSFLEYFWDNYITFDMGISKPFNKKTIDEPLVYSWALTNTNREVIKKGTSKVYFNDIKKNRRAAANDGVMLWSHSYLWERKKWQMLHRINALKIGRVFEKGEYAIYLFHGERIGELTDDNFAASFTVVDRGTFYMNNIMPAIISAAVAGVVSLVVSLLVK